MKRLDHSGQKMGRLTILADAENRKGARYAFCRCECGVEKVVRLASLLSGAVRSCGCLHMERCASGLNRLRHGCARKESVTRLHSIWRGMLKRCNPNSNKFATERYASRGISVCAEWHVFSVFKDWAEANGYSDDLTIERKDVNGNYEPGNCCWATKKDQSRNRTTTRHITVNDKTQCLAAWLEDVGVTRSAFHARVKRGKTELQALGF